MASTLIRQHMDDLRYGQAILSTISLEQLFVLTTLFTSRDRHAVSFLLLDQPETPLPS